MCLWWYVLPGARICQGKVYHNIDSLNSPWLLLPLASTGPRVALTPSQVISHTNPYFCCPQPRSRVHTVAILVGEEWEFFLNLSQIVEFGILK